MLTNLKIKNYRSLKDFEVSFGPLNVLIGANGSGKSNILDVLRLVQEYTLGGRLEYKKTSFTSRRGFEQVMSGRQTDQSISFSLDWEEHGVQSMQYEADLIADKQGVVFLI